MTTDTRRGVRRQATMIYIIDGEFVQNLKVNKLDDWEALNMHSSKKNFRNDFFSSCFLMRGDNHESKTILLVKCANYIYN